MGEAYFYHLSESDSAQTLRMLLPKALSAGWLVELRGPSPEVIAEMDLALWREPPHGFLPHGIAGGPHDARQPILLCAGAAPAPAPRDCLMSFGNAQIQAAELSNYKRTCILFSAHLPEELSQARSLWREVKAAGHKAQYWAQEHSGWVKKAES